MNTSLLTCLVFFLVIFCCFFPSILLENRTCHAIRLLIRYIWMFWPEICPRWLQFWSLLLTGTRTGTRCCPGVLVSWCCPGKEKVFQIFHDFPWFSWYLQIQFHAKFHCIRRQHKFPWKFMLIKDLTVFYRKCFLFSNYFPICY